MSGHRPWSKVRRSAPADPDSNVKYAYYCRGCQGTLFRVAWYASPRDHDGTPKPPGWAIECDGCGRVTLIPETPDLTELETAP